MAATKRGRKVTTKKAPAKKAPAKKVAAKKVAAKKVAAKKVAAKKAPAKKVRDKRRDDEQLRLLENKEIDDRVGVDVKLIGRPRKWDDADKFMKEVNRWILLRKKRMGWTFVSKMGGLVKVPEPKPLTIASLCNYLDISTETFRRWSADEDHPLWGICQMVRTVIEADLWDSESSSAKLNLQSNFGHRTKTDVTTDGNELKAPAALSIDPSKLTDEELKAAVYALRKARVNDETGG